MATTISPSDGEFFGNRHLVATHYLEFFNSLLRPFIFIFYSTCQNSFLEFVVCGVTNTATIMGTFLFKIH